MAKARVALELLVRLELLAEAAVARVRRERRA
jgi:hypothetical protein